MTAFVRVRKLADLVNAIDRAGKQVEIAHDAGLTTPRVNELYKGRRAVIEVRKARRLEHALGVPLGSLFVAVDRDLLLPYFDLVNPPAPVAQSPSQPQSPAAAPATTPARTLPYASRPRSFPTGPIPTHGPVHGPVHGPLHGFPHGGHA